MFRDGVSVPYIKWLGIMMIWNYIEILKICKSAFHILEFGYNYNYIFDDNGMTT